MKIIKLTPQEEFEQELEIYKKTRRKYKKQFSSTVHKNLRK